MWVTLGIMYIFISPGVMQLEDCFKQAVTVMADKTTQVHMACMPIIKDLTSS
jgi:hypothetical protein